MKYRRPILALLTILFVGSVTPTAGAANVLGAAPPPQGSTEDAIIQALKATFEELGYSSSVESDFDNLGNPIWTIYAAGANFNAVAIYIKDLGSESRVRQEYNALDLGAIGGSRFTFHGYPAASIPPDLLWIGIGGYFGEVIAYGSSRTALQISEIFYHHAVASGFMLADETITTPTITPEITELPGGNITLTANQEGYEPATQTVDNSDHFGTINITGVVRDAQTGAGITGAVVQITSGANPLSTVADGDGSYFIIASVPSGQQAGDLPGLDFELEPIRALNLSLQSNQTTLPADGTSTAAITLRVADMEGNPLRDRTIDLTLKGEDGLGSILPTQGTTDTDGLLTATYTSFKPGADIPFPNNEHLVTIKATDRDLGEFTTLDLYVNQNVINAVGNQVIPACSQCLYPAEITMIVWDAWGSPIPSASVVVRLEGPNRDLGTLVTSPESNQRDTELRLETAQDGSATIYYKWRGPTDITEVIQNIVIMEEQTNAIITQEVQVHGLDLAIARVEQAGFTGVTNQQAFLKIYFKDRSHPDLDLDRFNLDSSNQFRVRVSIFQFESEGSGTSTPFEGAAGWDSDEGGLFVKMPATPHMPYVVPVNDGTSWYEIRVDAVDGDDIPLPDLFRGNNDTIIALETDSPAGWLHTWLSDGILTPHTYFGVMIKCVARFLPGLGDAITVIDTLNQVYNTDVLGLAQSTSQVLTDELQRRVTEYAPSKLTQLKASALNNIVSCLQDGYGVYKGNSQASALPSCGFCGKLSSPVPAPSYIPSSEEIDLGELWHQVDRFVHGMLMDTPDQRAILIYGLPSESVAMLDGGGQPLADPDLMSTGGGVAVYILPSESTYTLQVTTDSPFDLGVYQAGDSDGARATYRHNLQPEGEVMASMSIGGDSDYALDIDEDGDGAADRTLQATTTSLDVAKPTITVSQPALGSTVTGSKATLQADFADNAGGSGVDPASIQILLDGQDVTNLATLTPDGLSCEVSDLAVGEHRVWVKVSDGDGNVATAEWNFTSESSLLSNLNNPLLLAVGVGGALLLGLVGLIAIAISRRKSRGQPAMAPSQFPMTQDEHGYWWSQDPASGAWFLWDGSSWQPHRDPAVGGDLTPKN